MYNDGTPRAAFPSISSQWSRSRGYRWDWARDSQKYWREANLFPSDICWCSVDIWQMGPAINQQWHAIVSIQYLRYVWIKRTNGELNAHYEKVPTLIRLINVILSPSWMHLLSSFSSGGVHLKNLLLPWQNSTCMCVHIIHHHYLTTSTSSTMR